MVVRANLVQICRDIAEDPSIDGVSKFASVHSPEFERWWTNIQTSALGPYYEIRYTHDRTTDGQSEWIRIHDITEL